MKYLISSFQHIAVYVKHRFREQSVLYVMNASIVSQLSFHHSANAAVNQQIKKMYAMNALKNHTNSNEPGLWEAMRSHSEK